MNLKKTRIFSLIKAEIHVEINSFVPRYFSIVNCLAYIIVPYPKLRHYFNKHFMPWFFYLFFKKTISAVLHCARVLLCSCPAAVHGGARREHQGRINSYNLESNWDCFFWWLCIGIQEEGLCACWFCFISVHRFPGSYQINF